MDYRYPNDYPTMVERKEAAFKVLGISPEEGWRIQAMLRVHNAEDGVVRCAEAYRDAIAQWPHVIDNHKVQPIEDQLVAAVDYLRQVRDENEGPPWNADRRKP